MLEMEITPATVIIGLMVFCLVILAVGRLRKKGTCDCKECSSDAGSCSSCGAVDKMVADMEKTAEGTRGRV